MSEPWVPVPPPEAEGEGDLVPAHTQPATQVVVLCLECRTRFNPADRTCPRCGRQTEPGDPRARMRTDSTVTGDDTAGDESHNRKA